MASTSNNTTALIFSSVNMAKDTTYLPGLWGQISKKGTNVSAYGPLFPQNKMRGQAHPDLIKAVYMLSVAAGLEGNKLSDFPNFSLVKLGNSNYISEVEIGKDAAGISEYRITEVSFLNGTIRSAEIRDSRQTANFYTIKEAETMTANAVYDCTGLMLCFIGYLNEMSETDNLYPYTLADILSKAPTDTSLSGDDLAAALTEASSLLIGMSSTIQYGIQNAAIKATIPANGTCTQLTRNSLEGFVGTMVAGTPTFVSCGSSANGTQVSMRAAKAEFASFTAQFHWTDAEKALIPEIPDDFMVPVESMKIARRFVGTMNDRRPMKNFLWRAVTSYGKSTGVECIACMLGMPLLKMTCNTKTETQDFMSKFVPVTQDRKSNGDGDNDSSNQLEEILREISVEDIVYDPAGTYEQITGTSNPDATAEEVFALYTQSIQSVERMKSAGSGQQFKLVNSNFVKALASGYIIEVQEASRIKDSGVLVGLNEYDRPGAVIPLSDGSYVPRHPNALVIYTDNVGYDSCRPMDPSVLRRFACIIDSIELDKDTVIQRLQYNTGCKDQTLMNNLYDLWLKTQEYCIEHEITEGSVSVSELEAWLRLVMLEGSQSLRENFQDAVLSKASSDADERSAILTAVEPYF